MYCLMAAHVYIDLWKETGEFSSLLSPDPFLLLQRLMHAALCFAGDEGAAWQALGVLLDGLSHSASNAQFKLLLLLLYCHLGAFEPVVDLYYNLDAKHVQHDTIGSVPAGGFYRSNRLIEVPWDRMKSSRAAPEDLFSFVHAGFC